DKAGKIHRSMTRKEAEQVLGVSRYGPAGPSEDEDPAMYILDDLMHELRDLGLLIEGPDYPPDAYCFVREVEPHDWMLYLDLLEDDKGVEARAEIYLCPDTSEYVEWSKKFPLNVTARKIYDWMARCEKELDKPGCRSKH